MSAGRATFNRSEWPAPVAAPEYRALVSLVLEQLALAVGHNRDTAFGGSR
jgi:hypothetical protein